MNDFKRRVAVRTFLVWSILGFLGAALVKDGHVDRDHVWLWLPLHAASAAVSGRAGLLITAARRGGVTVAPGGRRYSFVRWGLPALVIGLVVGLGLAYAVVNAGRGFRFTILLLGPLSSVISVYASRAPESFAPRQESTLRLCLVDTAVWFGLLAGPIGLAVLASRLPERDAVMTGAAFSREIAGTLMFYGLWIGASAFAKTRAERVSGLVDCAPFNAPVPGPLAVAGIGAVGFLLVGPRVLDEMNSTTLMWTQGLICTVGGLCFGVLGALKGARDPDKPDGPRR